MSEAKQNREQTLFEAASQKLAAEERRAFLDRECRDDPALRARLEVLLEGHFRSEGFLTQSPKREASLQGFPPSEPPPPVIGRYKLLEKIGEGGFGEVWMAEQQEPVKRRVAVKILKLGMDTKQVVGRFEAERQALALMDHPNIARVLDAGTIGEIDPRSADFPVGEGGEGGGRGRAGWKTGVTGRPYFVMDLVRGIRITDYCDQHNLSSNDRLDLFISVCHAIQHAHQKGIIHRDIKPSNILVTLHDGVPVPKVIDFGIAKATQQELTDKTLFTQFQQFLGTPAYVSPEQAGMSGLDIDTRSDIYSLGVLLYELLVGRTPFEARELMQGGLDALRKMIREREPMRPSTRLNTLNAEEQTTTAHRRQTDAPKLVHLLRGDLDWIVMKCLEKDRTRRYDTANGLVMDIKRHLAHEPVEARPPDKLYRFQKLVRRNKLTFAAAAAVATALILGLAISSWQMVVARHAREVADTERERANAQAQEASESRQHARRLLYASDMNLAQQALKMNNLGRARRLLDRHQPQAGEEDLRGWEWRYLWQLTRSSALVILTNRTSRGYAVSLSPDGSRLAVGWMDGRVDLWDVPDRRWIRALTESNYTHKGRVAFSPISNLLAATAEPKVVTLYDLDSGKESVLWQAPDQGRWTVHDLAFSLDGTKVVLYAGLPVVGRPERNPDFRDGVWVVNASSAVVESHHPALHSGTVFHGAARVSPDNQRLYIALSDAVDYRYSIQCIDLITGNELWQTEPQRDLGLTALAISPDGRVLASGSGFGDPTIRIWDTSSGRLLARLEGHTGWVHRLAFTQDGRRLLSSGDQSIRFWDTNTWTEAKVLRGHTDEVQAVAISDPAHLVASTGKDGNLILWPEDGKIGTDGYRRLPENLQFNEVLPLDHSRVLLLPWGQPPGLLNLNRDSVPNSLPEILSSTSVLGRFSTNILCYWNNTNRVLVGELHGTEVIRLGDVVMDSGTRPIGLAYNPARQLLAWSEASSSMSVQLANLATPGRRTELSSDVPGLYDLTFSQDGNYLAAATMARDSSQSQAIETGHLRAWNVETRQMVASVVSIGGLIRDAAFAEGGRVLVVAIKSGDDHEIQFYDLLHPDRPPRKAPGRHSIRWLAVSPDERLVAASTFGGPVHLFDPEQGELITSLHGHLNASSGIAFSADGQRLISAGSGRDTIKLWDVQTHQELLTLAGTAALPHAARWSADGNVILAGPPWQAWIAPSWEEIAAAEAKEREKPEQP